MSHPKSRRVCVIFLARAGGIFPLFSIVKYEMHLRASITPGAIIAPVGHASIQRLHLPQSGKVAVAVFVRIFCGARSSVVIITARKTHVPNSFVIRHVFFPTSPNPASCAKARSKTGPVSTYDFVFAPGAIVEIKVSISFNFFPIIL